MLGGLLRARAPTGGIAAGVRFYGSAPRLAPGPGNAFPPRMRVSEIGLRRARHGGSRLAPCPQRPIHTSRPPGGATRPGSQTVPVEDCDAPLRSARSYAISSLPS